MRDYSKTAPTFWTGETGRKIRQAGRDAQVIAFYLFTCPNSNWIGLYYLPMPTLCHEVGITKEGALKALRSLSSIDYAHYDLESEVVWVPGTARYQIGESLKAGDNRIKGIIKDLQSYAKSRFCSDFIIRYSALYQIPENIPPTKPLASPFEDPPKPVTEAVAVAVAVAVAETKAPSRGNGCRGEPDDFSKFWKSYPRKENKHSALKSFSTLHPSGELVATMLAWIREACKSEQWQDKNKIPHPATWLNQRRWEGDPPPVARSAVRGNPDVLDRMLAEAEEEERKCQPTKER